MATTTKKVKKAEPAGPNVELLERICEHMLADPEDCFSLPRVVTILLNISDMQRTSLFYPEFWPSDLRARLFAAKPSTSKYADVVVARIKHFIKTGK